MYDLDYIEGTLAGPVDESALAYLSQNHRLVDSSYLKHQRQYHGGKPKIRHFFANGKERFFGRFLTLVGSHFDLSPPFQGNYSEDPDLRISQSIYYIMETDCRLSFALVGEKLTPFASLARNTEHDVDMSGVQEGDIHVICFDSRENSRRQRISILKPYEGQAEFFKFEEGEITSEQVNYDKSTEVIAENYDEFIAMLKPA